MNQNKLIWLFTGLGFIIFAGTLADNPTKETFSFTGFVFLIMSIFDN